MRPQTSSIARSVAVASFSCVFSLALFAQDPPPTISSLKGVPVPGPSASELAQYVTNKPLAIALGKALFWEQQVGSDGVQSCATCHFHAGADARSMNQVSPTGASGTDNVFSLPGPNGQLSYSHFPTSTNDVVSSQGVFKSTFGWITLGSAIDGLMGTAWDSVWNLLGKNVRRVEPRNTPTAVNAVFNFRNFWDGRAKERFNGVTPFGDQDPASWVAKLNSGSLQSVHISISRSSLASQAVGPPGSAFEMAAEGRAFPLLGRKLFALRPLGLQVISGTDSVLGTFKNPSGNGFANQYTYQSLIQGAFGSQWWSGNQIVVVNPDRSLSFRSTPTGAANEFTQMEYNFSLFFGLAVQLYEATLVSDDSKFDRAAAGIGSLTSEEELGKQMFLTKGKCVNCHGGPETTNASVENVNRNLIERMIMGNNQPAVYDNGFYNIGVRPTAEDIAVGGVDPWGQPLSFSRLFQSLGLTPFVEGDPIELSGPLSPTERVAVDGAFKTPGLRNVELTAPYFHNGGKGTLRQVVDFYNQGGDFNNQNIANLDPDIGFIGFTPEEKTALVKFLLTLTDDRVRRHKAPFDHPSLLIPNGSPSNCRGSATAPNCKDNFIALTEVGAAGYAPGSEPQPFAGISQQP
jgi:cytochrome c peroxidase